MQCRTAYEKQVLRILKQIKRKGQLIQWLNTVDDVPPDTQKDWEPGPPIITIYPIFMVILPEDLRDTFVQAHKKDTLITEGMELALIGGQSFSPTLKDTIIVKNVTKVVRYIDTLAPGGIDLLHTIGLAT